MIELDDKTIRKVKKALGQHDKVKAMKLVIGAARCGLGEAKEYIDNLADDL